MIIYTQCLIKVQRLNYKPKAKAKWELVQMKLCFS